MKRPNEETKVSSPLKADFRYPRIRFQGVFLYISNEIPRKTDTDHWSFIFFYISRILVHVSKSLPITDKSYRSLEIHHRALTARILDMKSRFKKKITNILEMMKKTYLDLWNEFRFAIGWCSRRRRRSRGFRLPFFFSSARRRTRRLTRSFICKTRMRENKWTKGTQKGKAKGTNIKDESANESSKGQFGKKTTGRQKSKRTNTKETYEQKSKCENNQSCKETSSLKVSKPVSFPLSVFVVAGETSGLNVRFIVIVNASFFVPSHFMGSVSGFQ